jgi:hypothetical protein
LAQRHRLRASLFTGCIFAILLASHSTFRESSTLSISLEVLIDVFGIMLWYGVYCFDKAKTDFYKETGVYVPWPNRYSYDSEANRALKGSAHWKRARFGINMMLIASFGGVVGFFIVLLAASPHHHNVGAM